jgi:hypothetical protein
MAVANALAYYNTAEMTAVKFFMVPARLKAFEVVKKRSSLPSFKQKRQFLPNNKMKMMVCVTLRHSASPLLPFGGGTTELVVF